MKRKLGNTPVIAPLPVLIVATYDENGVPNAMNAAWGGQCDIVGKAFCDGGKIK